MSRGFVGCSLKSPYFPLNPLNWFPSRTVHRERAEFYKITRYGQETNITNSQHPSVREGGRSPRDYRVSRGGYPVAISVSTKMVRLLIASGRLKAVNLGKRMTRISLQELTDFAQGQGCNVVLPSSFPSFNNEKREKKKPDVSAKPETGNVNKKAKCRTTPASDIAPEGVTHDSHYTLVEVMRKFGIKYGRLYEVRNRFQLPSVHAWGTTAFRKEDVEEAIAKYNEEPTHERGQSGTTCSSFAEREGGRPKVNRARHRRRHTTPASTSCRSTVWERRKYAVLPRHTVSVSRKPRAAGLTSTLKRTGKQPERKPRKQVPAQRQNGHEYANVGTTCWDG